MYQECLKHLSAPIIAISKSKKEIVFINDSCCKLLNVNSSVIGESTEKIFPDLYVGLENDILSVGVFATREININNKRLKVNYISLIEEQNLNIVLLEFLVPDNDNVEGSLLNNNEYKAIIDASYDGLYITNKYGNTIFVSKSYEKITGINREELLGKNIIELEKSGMFSPIITPSILKSKTPITCNQRLRNGKKVIITGNPVFDSEGEVAYIVTNVRDITELVDLRSVIIKQKKINYEYMQKLSKIEEEKKIVQSFIAKSRAMQGVLSFASKVANVNTTVLITGETGVGKEVLANYIYKLSDRCNKPFLSINCGAVAANLLESELFGYVKGAFTGALNKDKPGLFEAVDNGTLFLDEIGDMPLDLQVKLLRVLQQGEVKRVGSTENITVDVRLICATNKNLEELVKQGKFREDLFYRLNVVAVEVPPLRKRIEDIPHLAHHFCNYFNSKYQMKKRLTTELINTLMDYNWPGNIRELKNLIEQLVILSGEDEIGISSLPPKMLSAKSKNIVLPNGLPLKKITLIQDNHNINISSHYKNFDSTDNTGYYIDCSIHNLADLEKTLIHILSESKKRLDNTAVFLHRIFPGLIELFPKIIEDYQSARCELICSANIDLIMELENSPKYQHIRPYITVLNLPSGIILTNKSNNNEELVDYYFEYYCNKYKISCILSSDAKKCLVNYKWNDEEHLKKVLEHLVLKNYHTIQVFHLPKDVTYQHAKPIQINQIMPIKDAVMEIERQLIEMAIRKNGSKRKAALELGIDPSSIGRKMARYSFIS